MRFLVMAGIYFVCASAFCHVPFDFKGLRLGSPLSTVRAGSQYKCGKSELPDFDSACTLREGAYITLAGVRAESLDLKFLSGRLVFIHVRFASDDFDIVESALRDKYGAPKQVKVSTLTNRFGAKFNNQESLWDNGISQLSARRFTETNVQVSTVTYSLNSAEQELTRRHDERQKKRAKDL